MACGSLFQGGPPEGSKVLPASKPIIAARVKIHCKIENLKRIRRTGMFFSLKSEAGGEFFRPGRPGISRILFR